MTALATQNAGNLDLEDLSLEELLDARRGNAEYVAWLKAERTAADHVLGDIDTMIKLRMEEKRSRMFEHAGFKGAYVMQKSGSAAMLSPAIARQKLRALPEVPKHVVDEIFEDVTPATFVKGDLRKFRKAAAYSGAAADVVKAFISEPIETEALVIEEIRPMIDVTASIKASALSGQKEIVLVEDDG